MLFIAAILIGVLIGYLRRGRISHLASLRLRLLALIVVATLIQVLIFPLFGERALFPYATTFFHLLSYGLVFLFLAFNYRLLPIVLIGCGAILNLLPIAFNGGYMPSSHAALSRAGGAEIAARLVDEGQVGNVVLMSDQTRLNILGDFLYLPEQVPLAAAFSLGDLVIALGIAWLIARGMRKG